MNFLHNDLGNLSGEEVVEVTLDTAANVKLMDSANFAAIRGAVSTAITVGLQNAHRCNCPCRMRGTGMSPSILVAMPARSERALSLRNSPSLTIFKWYLAHAFRKGTFLAIGPGVLRLPKAARPWSRRRRSPDWCPSYNSRRGSRERRCRGRSPPVSPSARLGLTKGRS
jgi:hypothetical protein